MFLLKFESVVTHWSALSFSFLCMSPTRSRYKELGLELVEPLQDQPHKYRMPPMEKEKKDEGA